MNTVMLTGWLQKDSWSAVVPGSGKRLLLFDLMVANEGGEPAPWRCEIADEAHALKVAPKLSPGAGVIVRAELRARPFHKHGVFEGFSRYLLVDHVEFSRLPVAAEQTETAASS